MLESGKLFICSVSEVSCSQQLEKVYFVDKPANEESDLPSIIATVAGGKKLYAVYHETSTNPDGMEKAKSMLWSHNIDQCNWSTGNVDLHVLKSIALEMEDKEEWEDDLVIVNKDDIVSDDSDLELDIIGPDEGIPVCHSHL